jgi:transposase
MNSTIKTRWTHALLWLFWFATLLALACGGGLPLETLAHGASPLGGVTPSSSPSAPPALALVLTVDSPGGWLFPWQPHSRWRKWAWRHWQAARRSYQRAVWAARVARLLRGGTLTMAMVVDWLTRAQLRRQLGALPFLYALLEILQVRTIINRDCPSAAEVDLGTVALVLVLNRLTAPRPLYKVADWLAQTVLVQTLGLPAAKFNDDRLGRTLDALAPHAREIWLDIVHQALLRFDIDLHFVFYDLTAFVAQGAFSESELIDYGFAHNTPSDQPKVKAGVDATGDGFIPTEYTLWSGRTADLATVQQNMERLCRLLQRRGYPLNEVLIIGDRANLNDELALAYDTQGLHYLAGLQPQKKAHAELLVELPEMQFTAYLVGAPGYWGWPCHVTFHHQGQTVTHRGLVVLSGPMRSALRQDRAAKLRALRAELASVQAKIGQKRYRSVKEVQARANTNPESGFRGCLRRSPVGKLMGAEASATDDGQVHLRWWVNRYALWQAMQRDGRYLLVTNDWRLSPARMLELYRAKDGVEKRFEVAKQDLKVSPLYVHSDARITGLLLVNMLALLAYSLLERQVQRRGVNLTTRRIIERLESLAVIETQPALAVLGCWDGSVLYRLTPVTEAQARLLQVLCEVLGESRELLTGPTRLVLPHWLPALPDAAQPLVRGWLSPPLAAAPCG